MITPSHILGTRLGVYEVQSVLGHGGMATVYRGFDHNLQRPVAIKVLSELAATQPGFADRFRQEARMIARLRHPHIVHVYDFGVLDQVVYMVQELLPGQVLSERLTELAARNQPMPRREIIAVIQQLAAALDAAHAAGIIHRDVKPSNALYNANGALVLTDFGIAKSTAMDATKTQTGIILGTPTYVSPEQARGEVLTPASDIYALGVVLYELISGRPPFDGETPLGIVLKHLHDPPPALQPLRTSVTPAVEAVVQRALAKRPEDRYATATELAKALEVAWLEPQPGAPAASIHTLPTTAWQAPDQSVRPSHTTASTTIAAPRTALPTDSAADGHLSTPPRTTAAAQSGKNLLPLLAVLLIAALFGGIILAWRSERPVGMRTDTTLVATETAHQDPAPTAPPLAKATDESAGRLNAARALLGAQASLEMQTSLDTAEQALETGDSTRAIEALSGLQQQILQARRAGTISSETMRSVLAAIQDVAKRAGLRLPLQIGA